MVMICDFCSDPYSIDVFFSDPLNTILTIEGCDPLIITIDEQWYACAICSSLIRSGNQMGLEKRSMDSYVQKHVACDERIRIYLNVLHSHFMRTVRLPSRN